MVEKRHFWSKEKFFLWIEKPSRIISHFLSFWSKMIKMNKTNLKLAQWFFTSQNEVKMPKIGDFSPIFGGKSPKTSQAKAVFAHFDQNLPLILIKNDQKMAKKASRSTSPLPGDS